MDVLLSSCSPHPQPTVEFWTGILSWIVQPAAISSCNILKFNWSRWKGRVSHFIFHLEPEDSCGIIHMASLRIISKEKGAAKLWIYGDHTVPLKNYRITSIRCCKISNNRCLTATIKQTWEAGCELMIRWDPDSLDAGREEWKDYVGSASREN